MASCSKDRMDPRGALFGDGLGRREDTGLGLAGVCSRFGEISGFIGTIFGLEGVRGDAIRLRDSSLGIAGVGAPIAATGANSISTSAAS